MAAVLLAPVAWAQDTVLAESLYQTGKQLFDKGRYAEACPKLAESQRLDPAGGTVLMLGLCYEKEGKLASAYTALSEAQAQAKRDRRDDREKAARARLAGLESRVPRVTIEVPPEVASLPGLRVLRSGAPVPPVSFGVALLTDPGPVEVVAEAPGREPFRGSTTAREGASVSLRVDPLRPLPAAPPPVASSAPAPSAVEPPPPGPRPAPTLAYALAGGGLLALGFGAFFGVKAIGDAHSVRDRCGSSPSCADRSAVDLAHTADREATVANIAVPVGAAALTAGLLLYLLRKPAPEPAAARLRLLPQPGRAPGLVALGVF